jgi:hypothetical protein
MGQAMTIGQIHHIPMDENIAEWKLYSSTIDFCQSITPFGLWMCHEED